MDELLQALRVSSPHLDTTKVPFDASGNHVSIVHLVASISKTQLGTGAPPMSQRTPSATINKYFSTQ